MRPRLKRGLVRLAQAGLVLGSIGLVVLTTDWRRSIELLSEIEPTIAAIVIVVTIVQFLARSYTWYVLLNFLHPTSFRTAVRLDVIIKYVNFFTPSRTVGAMATPFLFREYTDHSWAESISVTGLQMGLYSGLYGLTTVLGVLALFGQLPLGIVVLVALAGTLYLALTGAVYVVGFRSDAIHRLIRDGASLLPYTDLWGKVAGLLLARVPPLDEQSSVIFRRMATNPTDTIHYTLAWTLNIIVLASLRVWLLLAGFGVEFAPFYLLPVVLVMAYSVTLLPITPGGIGIAEASATVVLIAVGVPSHVAAPVVFLDRFLGQYLILFVAWYPMLEVDLTRIAADEK